MDLINLERVYYFPRMFHDFLIWSYSHSRLFYEGISSIWLIQFIVWFLVVSFYKKTWFDKRQKPSKSNINFKSNAIARYFYHSLIFLYVTIFVIYFLTSYYLGIQ